MGGKGGRVGGREGGVVGGGSEGGRLGREGGRRVQLAGGLARPAREILNSLSASLEKQSKNPMGVRKLRLKKQLVTIFGLRPHGHKALDLARKGHRAHDGGHMAQALPQSQHNMFTRSHIKSA